MIILNGKKFGLNDNEMIDSLFKGKTTCVGFYKVNKKTITLQNLQKKKIGVINEHGLLCSARKLNGKYWYSFATINEIGEYESYRQSVEEPKAIYDNLITL